MMPSPVASPPQTPIPERRPANWPGAADTAAQGEAYVTDSRARAADRDAGAAAVDEPKLCVGAQPLATVGREWILAAEVLGEVNQIFDQNKAALAALSPTEIEEQRNILIRQRLQPKIETKLIYLDAKKTIPAENLPKIEQSIGDAFEKSVVPAMVEHAKLQSRQQLDARLQSFGSSLDRQKRSFIEQELAKEWVRQQVKDTDTISVEQMRTCYEEHLKDYEHPAHARWEQLTVRVSDYRSKQEAFAAIAEMGNQVWDGAPLAQVAKARSKGPTAAEGGARDWTRQGSLVSQVLNEAIFSLPVGNLSQILDDGQELHVVRVIERKEAGRTPFLEAQVEIRKTLHEQCSRKQLDDYLARLRKEIPVWTVFDGPGGSPLAGQPKTLRR
jgi:parvulin-like peptidyl-prolyl isomerase